MKITVMNRYSGHGTTTMRADRGQVTQRQYNAAMRRLGTGDGDYLRLSRAGNDEVSQIMVTDHGRLVAVID